MFIKLICLCLCCTVFYTTVDASLKCSDAPANICGSHAKCYDKHDQISNYIGPYCRCDVGFVGRPPKCKDGCRNDHECKENEYCSENHDCEVGCNNFNCKSNEICDQDTRKCIKGCNRHDQCESDEFCNESIKNCDKICDKHECGPNTKCVGEYNLKFCTCADGYVLVKRGLYSICEKMQNDSFKLTCSNSCGKNSFCDIKNGSVYCYCRDDLSSIPFVRCKERPPSPTHRPIKPHQDETIVSLQFVMASVG